MDEETLLSWYDQVARTTGFQPTDEKPWLPVISPGNFRELKQNGQWRDKPVTLQIVPNENLTPDMAWQRDMAEDHNKAAATGAVRIPQVLTEWKTDEYVFLILERPDGRRIIADESFKKPFQRGDDTYRKIQETAKVHWATVETLHQLVNRASPLKEAVGQASAVDYFVNDRFPKWEKIWEEQEKRIPHFVPRTLKAKILIAILNRNTGVERPMEMSFNLFGNTDIIKVSDTSYYLVNGHFEIKPRGFAPAAWIWNLMLHSGPKNENQVLKEALAAVRIFAKGAGFKKYAYDILANLLERIYAGLEIDLSLHRSPHDQDKQGPEFFQTVKNFKHVLDQVLKFISF